MDDKKYTIERKNDEYIEIFTRFDIPENLLIILKSTAGVNDAYKSERYEVTLKRGDLFTISEVMENLINKIDKYLSNGGLSSASERELKDMLIDAINEEDYKLAAKIRDNLKKKK